MLLTPKHLPRFAAIVGVFTQCGLRNVAKQQGLLTLLGDGEALPPEAVANQSAHAAALRARLIELGPARVKLG